MVQNLVFNVCLALIVAMIGVVTKSLLPYLRQKKEEATAKIRQTKWAWAADIIDAVVRAVEQTVEEDLHGEGKKDIAKQYIADMFSKAGIALSDVEIDTLIEAAVQAMNEGLFPNQLIDEVQPVIEEGGVE